jgi:glycosyltransferase involved in cell wall biosynthesis
VKVGIVIGSTAPEEGGGFTFVTEFLRALQGVQAGCRHEFVICHRKKAGPLAEMFPKFPAVDLHAEAKEMCSPREKLARSISRQLMKRLPPALRNPARLGGEDRVFERHGIQFLIQIQPSLMMSQDIPYGALVWDLQHRNNPWFPEVCATGEWEGRDAHFALLLRRASIVFTSTEQGRREIVAYYQVPAGRIKVLQFPTPQFALAAADAPPNPGLLRGLGVPADYLFYPAQFWPHKNHVVVLEACKLIREQTGWDLGVVFTGCDHGNGDYVKRYARELGLEKRTVFLGFVKQTELIELYKGAFSLAFATFCGPDNFPPLEAFALGCPVVASAVPGAEEQLGNAALLFPPEDEHALAEKVLSLRDPQTRSRLIALGRMRARAHTWEDYARRVVASLDEFSRVRRAW